MAAGIATGFVRKLYRILDLESDAIISWDPTGLSFSIHDSEQLNETILPRYFRGRLCAFRQQLIDHGFEQLECEDNETREVYRHDHFLKGCPAQLSLIKRVPKPKRRPTAPGAAASAPPPTMAGMVKLFQAPAARPSSLTVTLNAGSMGAVKRISPSNDAHTVEQSKRLRMEPPLMVTAKLTTAANSSARNGALSVGNGGLNPRTASSNNPLFSNEPDSGSLSFARLAESGLLPCSSDLPEPISYLTKMTQAVTSSFTQQQPSHPRTSEPPMFSDDLFRSALFFLASTSTTGVEPPSNGSASAASDSKTSIDKNGNVSVSSNLLSMLLASSTSGMPPAAASSANGGWGSTSSNPLFSDQSTGEDDEDQDSIWNLLVSSSIDRVKSAIVDLETPQERLKMILAERERLEEQRKKFGRGAHTATSSTAAETTNGILQSSGQKPPAAQNALFAKTSASENPAFAKASATTPNPPSAKSSTATSNPLFAKSSRTASNPLFAKSSAASNPLFAKAAPTASSDHPVVAATRAGPNEDDLWRLLMSSSIDSFRRVGEFEV